jgi:hypothetical protein
LVISNCVLTFVPDKASAFKEIKASDETHPINQEMMTKGQVRSVAWTAQKLN